MFAKKNDTMDRLAMNNLKQWKESPNRKPLIIKGARQVGKTWLMKEFGKKEYAQTAYLNFESSTSLQTLFSGNYDINRIMNAIQIETGVQVNPENTLIVLDEIQESEGAITSLKYFCENAPQYHVIAAGSLLGIALHKETSFPVGKVDFMTLYPMSFCEFIMALDQKLLSDLLKSIDWQLITTFKSKYIELLRQYYFIGGMPEAVYSFSVNNDFKEVRTIQKLLLDAYQQDFSKHAPFEIVPRIRMLWNSILSQLSKENKKFIYGAIKQGARAKDYETALSWLIDCGLVHQINRVSKPGFPLKAYEDFSAFKLFLLDIGLLGAMGDIDAKTMINGNAIFEEFKGSMTEQFVLQELISQDDLAIYYWSSEKSSGEIDFIVQANGEVIPVEVKAEENLQAKSLKSFRDKYKPKLSIRTSMSDYREQDWLTNIPLYAISSIKNFRSI